jgi:predicted nucleic acid-binding protein
MELRSAQSLTTDEKAWLTRFIRDVKVLDISTSVKENAINIRSTRKVKLPDAIVAATAISHQAELLTNDKGLHKIEGVVARVVKIAT